MYRSLITTAAYYSVDGGVMEVSVCWPTVCSVVGAVSAVVEVEFPCVDVVASELAVVLDVLDELEVFDDVPEGIEVGEVQHPATLIGLIIWASLNLPVPKLVEIKVFIESAKSFPPSLEI